MSDDKITQNLNIEDVDFDLSKQVLILVTNNLKENPLDNAFIEGQDAMHEDINMFQDDILISNEIDDVKAAQLEPVAQVIIKNENLAKLIEKEKQALERVKKEICKMSFNEMVCNVKGLYDKLDGINKIKKLKSKLRAKTSQEVSAINSRISVENIKEIK
jgi:hypothetical protein